MPISSHVLLRQIAGGTAFAFLTSVAAPAVAAPPPPPPPPPGGGDEMAVADDVAPPAPAADPAAPPAPPAESDKDRAKRLFGEGNEAMAAEDYFTAVSRFEEAYALMPELHLFNYNIGLAAHAAGDCNKAQLAFQRFLDLVDDHPERDTATAKLEEIMASGCLQQSVVADDEDAPLTSRHDQREEKVVEEKTEVSKHKLNQLMLAGVISSSVGGALLLAGLGGWGAGAAKAKTLRDASEGGEGTGFADGDYADDSTYNADNQRRASVAIMGVGLAAGTLAVGAGVALIIIGKKQRDAATGGTDDTTDDGPELTSVGPMMVPRGGGIGASWKF